MPFNHEREGRCYEVDPFNAKVSYQTIHDQYVLFNSNATNETHRRNYHIFLESILKKVSLPKHETLRFNEAIISNTSFLSSVTHIRLRLPIHKL